MLRIQRALMGFIAAVYLFIGLIHPTAHVNKTIGDLNKAISATISLQVSLAATDRTDNSDSERLSADGEYCQVYAPILMPVLARVAAPTPHIVQLRFGAPRLLVEGLTRLDTPPPKRLI